MNTSDQIWKNIILIVMCVECISSLSRAYEL